MSYDSTVLVEATLIEYWLLNEASGDSVGQKAGIHMVPGASTASPNHAGAAPFSGAGASWAYDGSNDYSSAAINLTGVGVNGATLEFWASWASPGGFLMEHTVAADTNLGGFWVNPQTGTPNVFQVAKNQSSSNNYDYGHFTVSIGSVFHHYMIFMDGDTATITTYVDGVAVSFTADHTGSHDTPGFANSTLYLGGRAGSTFFAPASLGRLAIYNGDLTGQAATHFAAATPAVGGAPSNMLLLGVG